MAQVGAEKVLGDHIATGPGTAVALGSTRLEGSQIVIRGTFVGTVSIEVSTDNGSNYVTARDIANNELSGITAGRGAVLAGAATHIRSNCTAFTSGTIVVRHLVD